VRCQGSHDCPVNTRAGGAAGRATGAEGTVVGGDRVEGVPDVVGVVVGGVVPNVVGGDEVDVEPFTDAMGATEDLAWLGVS